MRTIVSNRLRTRRMWFGAALVAATAVGAVLGSSFAGGSASAAQAPTRAFSGQVGIIVNFVNSANTADYEGVMKAFSESLTSSDSAQRKQMGAGFKLYRAAEMGPNNSAIYYSIFNPAISGAEYEPITVLSDDYLSGPPENGDEVRALYADYSEALAPGGAQVNLRLVAGF
ncbi:MAG TPA: hypothetical protein EYQ83_17645 [Acidobacteria bacterium]|nr:hypothetical protein [Acidobacteriota bacterium]